MTFSPSRWPAACAAALQRSTLLLAALLFVALHHAPAQAAAHLRDYTHTMWSVRDGAPPEIKSIAQTDDGMLWLGTPAGLFRFDGVRFERVALPAGAERLKRINSVMARPGNEVWISDDVEHLVVLRDGKVRDMTPDLDRPSGIGTLAFDHEGGIWAATGNGLLHHSGGKWRTLGPAEGLEPRTAHSVLVDQHGQVWASMITGLYLYDRAAGRFRRVMDSPPTAMLTQSPDGGVWLLGDDSVVAVPMPPQSADLPRVPDFNRTESRSNGQFDRDGNLWSVRCPAGLCLVSAAAKGSRWDLSRATERPDGADQTWQLSSTSTNCVLEDREGNLWVGTQGGLDRLRVNKVVRVPVPGATGMYTMARDPAGNVWVAEPSGATAWKVAPDGSVTPDRSQPFTVVTNDRDGALLLAGRREIVRRGADGEERIALPPLADGRRVDHFVFGIRDDGETLWVLSNVVGLVGYVDGVWYPREHWAFPPKVYTSGGVGKGSMWLALADGALVLWDHGRQTRYDGGVIGLVSGLFPGTDMVAGGDKGLAVLQGGKFRLLHANDPEVLLNVSGLAVAPNGDRWLNGQRGIVHVKAADWRAAVADPKVPLRYQLIDNRDGYPGRAMLENRQASIFTGPDGQLWFMATGGIARLDPARMRRNPYPPQVRVDSVGTDGAEHAGTGTVRLPAGSQRFAVTFGAPSLGRADAVRFQYQLVGLDTEWQDGGVRRTAWYTNVGPGSYVFRVRAVNEDGVASPRDGELAIDVAPTLTQTTWFRVLLALAVAGMLYLLYRYRLHVATARVAERLNVKLDERERIARTLHDTFLQSVQALVLRVHAAAAELPPGSPVRNKLDAVLEQADRTLTEGRDQVHELRSGRDVEHALTDAGQGLAAAFPHTAFALDVTGRRVPLQPHVQEELCEAGSEALRNAFRHARAAHVTVTLAYRADSLLLRIADDGCGMRDVARVRERHWGIVGMRERAARIGAAFTMASAPDQGTTVEFTVPARLAYAESPARERSPH